MTDFGDLANSESRPASGHAADPSDGRRLLSVVIPVFKNEATLPSLVARLEALELPNGMGLEAVFVVDGSPDRSAQVLRSALSTSTLRSTLVELSRNFGSFPAIRAGLERSSGDYFAVMAADLQEPPELLIRFAEELETGEFDLVLGRREGRADPAISKGSSRLFWWTYKRFVQPEMPTGGVDVFACNKVVRSAVLQLRESHSSLVGLLIWLGMRSTTVPYERLPRAEGKSSWSTRKKFRYMSDSIFSFTDLPIQVLLLVGSVGTVLVTAAALVVFVAWAAGLVKVHGYTPLLLSILFTGGLLTFSLGVVGSYVWRTYENTKRRPLTVEQSVERYRTEAQ